MKNQQKVTTVFLVEFAKRVSGSRLAFVGLTAIFIVFMPHRADASTQQLARAALEKLPGFEFAVGRNTTLTYVDGVFIADLPGVESTVSVFQARPGAGQPWHAHVLSRNPEKFSFKTISQRLAEKVLGDVSLTQVIMIVSSADNESLLADLPTPIGIGLAGFEDAGGKVKLLKGVNIFSSMRVGQQGLLGVINRTLNIGDQEILLAGQLDKETLKMALGRSDSDDATPTPPAESRIALAVSIPSVTPIPFGVVGDKSTLHLMYPSTRLSILRTSQGANEAYEIKGSQQARIWVFNHQVDMTNSLTVETKPDQSYSVGVAGEVDVGLKNAFKVTGLNLDSLSMSGKFDFDNSDSEQAGNALGVKFGLKASVPGQSQLSGSVDSKVENNKLTDLKFTLEGADAESGIELGALPVINRLSMADRVRIERLIVGINPQTKDVYLKGTTQFKQRDIRADTSILRKKQANGEHAIILALKTDGLNLRKFVPSLPEKAEQISLDGGVMTFSSADMKSFKPGELPDAFKEIFSGFSSSDLESASSAISAGATSFGADFNIDVPMGTGITVPINMSALSGEARQALNRFGVTDPLILSGSIGGVFDGDPSLSLFAKMPNVPIPEIGGQRLNVRPTDIGGSLFVVVSRDGTSTELQLGIDGTLGMLIDDDKLDFGGRVFLALSSMAQGVQIAGRMMGEWDDPFGMVGISFSDVQLGGGINADSSIELNVLGTAEFGTNLDFALAADVSAIVGSGIPIPKKVGLMFQGSELSMLTGLKIHNALFKSAAAGPLANAIPDGPTKSLLQSFAQTDLISTVEDTIPLPFMKYTDVAVYLSTPGASVPGFDGIGGLGGAMRGTLSFMGREFGSTDSFLTLQNGLQIHSMPADFDMGPGISLKNAELDVRVPMPGMQNDEEGYALLKGEMSAGCDFMSGAVDIYFSRDLAKFSANGELAGYKTAFDAEVDLSEFPEFATMGGFSPDLATDIVSALKERAQQRFQERKAQAQVAADMARDKLNGAKSAVKNAVSEEAARIRGELQKELQGIVNYAAGRERAAKLPGEKQLWTTVKVAASKMKVEPNNTVSNVGPFKTALTAARNAISRVPAVGLKRARNRIQSLKNAAIGAVDHLRGAINATVAKVSNIMNTVEQLPRVQAARGAVDATQNAFEQAKQDVISVTLDPIAERIEEERGLLVIDDVGFDSGLDALCEKRLPQLNISGSFAGKPFFFPGLLQLASRSDFVATNGERLDAWMEDLGN